MPRYDRVHPAVIHLDEEHRVGNRRGATVRVEMIGDTWYVTVRPKGLRKFYRLPLGFVADMVCWKTAALEARR